MEPPPTQVRRPYRSHLQPACIACKKRKSRCQNEGSSAACLMCRNHGTPCVYPGIESPSQTRAPASSKRRQRQNNASKVQAESSRTSLPSTRTSPALVVGTQGLRRKPAQVSTVNLAPHNIETNVLGMSQTQMPYFQTVLGQHPVLGTHPNGDSVVPLSAAGPAADSSESASLLIPSRDDDHLNLHVVGPAGTNDSQIVSDYLSSMPGLSSRNTRIVRPAPATRQSKPVLFTMVHKRPVGITVKSSPSAEKLEIIEKLIEPHAEGLIDEYFQRVNPCFPLLDEAMFRRQLREDKNHISPALLACLYAHTVIYWQSSRILSKHRCPDVRYIWNLSNEALYSELRLSPGISTIEAIILDIGGRPTTSLIGNGVLLGSAVALAHSFGLNHSPLSWEIPHPEQMLRMRIWWNLLIHDRWISLANGTPPHLIEAQYDVPPPSLQYLNEENGVNGREDGALSIYIALYTLTEVLYQHLSSVYSISANALDVSTLELTLNAWVESLSGNTRQIVLRGTRLDTQGAANLRLAYLTTKLLQQRIFVESDKGKFRMEEPELQNRYTQAKRTCEDILLLTSELQPANIGDFWTSTSAFTFPATLNFLLRCALETNRSPDDVISSGSFSLAKQLIATLRSHQDEYGWELGDMCLSQHADIIEKIQAGAASVGQGESSSIGGIEAQDFTMLDSTLIDQLFPSLWNPLHGNW